LTVSARRKLLNVSKPPRKDVIQIMNYSISDAQLVRRVRRRMQQIDKCSRLIKKDFNNEPLSNCNPATRCDAALPFGSL
jgi:hypothetical protein